MPELVTLSSAPYNPYNDTFARYAMQGLGMGLSLMQHKDEMALKQQQMLMQGISEGTQSLFKGAELGLRNKELEHRMENDAFNNYLDTEKLKFSKDSFWAQNAQNDRRIDLDEDRFGLQESQFDYLKQHDAAVDDPYKQAQADQLRQSTEAARMNNNLFRDTYDTRVKATGIDLTKGILDNERQAAANDALSRTNDLYKENPDLQLRGIEAQISRDEASAKESAADAAWKASGGPMLGKMGASANETRTIIDTLRNSDKDIKGIEKELEKAKGSLKNWENGDKSNPNYNSGHRERTNKINELSDDLSARERQNALLEQNTDIAIQRLNEAMKLRGMQGIDTTGMNRVQKAGALYEAQAKLNLPGQGLPSDPANEILQQSNGSKPIGADSRNPPSTKSESNRLIGSPDTDF